MTVRPGTEADLAAIGAIYNHYVETSHATFDVVPWGEAQLAEWYARFSDEGRYRLFVREDGGRVTGYAYSGRLRPRPAYDTSVETTVYVAHDAAGSGVGSSLYAALFDALRGQDVHRAYAVIALPNDASIALHRRFGFAETGRFTEQGRKFDRYWDVAWLERGPI